jgi:hypothetical protein
VEIQGVSPQRTKTLASLFIVVPLVVYIINIEKNTPVVNGMLSFLM